MSPPLEKYLKSLLFHRPKEDDTFTNLSENSNNNKTRTTTMMIMEEEEEEEEAFRSSCPEFTVVRKRSCKFDIDDCSGTGTSTSTGTSTPDNNEHDAPSHNIKVQRKESSRSLDDGTQTHHRRLDECLSQTELVEAYQEDDSREFVQLAIPELKLQSPPMSPTAKKLPKNKRAVGLPQRDHHDSPKSTVDANILELVDLLTPTSPEQRNVYLEKFQEKQHQSRQRSFPLSLPL